MAGAGQPAAAQPVTDAAAATAVHPVATVRFRQPGTGPQDAGYLDARFKVEYQLLSCMGELQLAYAVVGDSVSLGRATYFLKNRIWHNASPPPPGINSIKLDALVKDASGVKIGGFTDPAVGTISSFSCGGVQTKPITNLANVLGPSPLPEQVAAYFSRLTVSFTTDQPNRSAEFEQVLLSSTDGRFDTPAPSVAAMPPPVAPPPMAPQMVAQPTIAAPVPSTPPLATPPAAAQVAAARAPIVTQPAVSSSSELTAARQEQAQQGDATAAYDAIKQRDEAFIRGQREREQAYQQQVSAHQQQMAAARAAQQQYEEQQRKFLQEKAAYEAQVRGKGK